jgi:beta-lactamase superfamily II metal-dependent hydrolase
MATPPTSLTLRMFNVGFGDCFLLTFNYANSVRHMLVDFGSTSAPKRGAKKDYMLRVAQKIKEICAGKLHIVVATHRHRDHISGFSTAAKTGKLIAQLNPDIVIQPWTEDPRAQSNALTAKSTLYTHGKADPRKMTGHFLGTLEDMHGVAAAAKRMAAHESLAARQPRAQLQFLGDDNLKNESAVRNLIRMGRKGKAYFVNAGMKLNILPGVACTVLGPPTLKQSDEIRAMRASDPGEFWQFRTFWASQNLAKRPGAARPLIPKGTPAIEPPAGVRWFIDQSRQIQADQMLGLVRDLDDVMNNTSVILLLEVGKQKILLPGDAQIENWSYALSKPDWCKRLADVNLYKVGHHGSRNATPKRLWHLFKHAGPALKADRIATLCSTQSGKHGSTRSGTEVPRHLLVKQLKENSQFTSSEEAEDSFCNEVTINF